MEPQVNHGQPQDIAPDLVPVKTMAETIIPPENLLPRNSGIATPSKAIQSPNFKSNSAGWYLDPSGNVQMNGNKMTSTHFTLVFKAHGVSFYVSDGTTPNGALSGTVGDVCFNGAAGKSYSCTVTGTTWVSFT